MFKTFISTILFTIIFGHIKAQTISGVLTQHVNQEISVTGFNYYNNYVLATTTTDSLGQFTLKLPQEYRGMGILQAQDNSRLILSLEEKVLKLRGTSLHQKDSLFYIKSASNTTLQQYVKVQEAYTKANYALGFLEKLYQNAPVFNGQQNIIQIIKNEKVRIQKEDIAFLASLPSESYVKWFIPYRKLIQDMQANVKGDVQQIPRVINQFRAINFNHPNFETSGLFKELLEGHYMLLENMGQPLDSIYLEMNKSTMYLIKNLKNNTSLLSSVSNDLFNYFEKRSLFKASEYLALNLLKDTQLKLEEKLIKKLERYRKMKVGNIAPDIKLYNNKLSDIKTHKLVVFGASWCPACKKEAIELLKYHTEWNAKNVSVVYISIDTDRTAFFTAFKEAPWQTYSDFKGWQTQSALDYSVIATPSYFLLDAENKILITPNSVAHANAWIKHNLY